MANSLFSNTEDIKSIINVVGTFNFDAVSPYLEPAQERYLTKYLSDDLLDALLARYNNPSEAEPESEEEVVVETNAALDLLMPYAQKVLAKFAFYLAVPKLDVQITSAGFVVTSNSSVSPASDKRVAAFRAAMEIDGWDMVESMLKFLEKNKNNYPTWVASSAYTTTYETFINCADDFDKIIRINRSRLEFQNLIPDMINVELLRIEPAISSEFATVIRNEIKSGEISERVNAILPNIRRAVAFYTWCDYGRSSTIMAGKHQDLANAYLASVKLILDDDPDTYTEYAASTSYNAEKVSDMKFDNSADNKLFVFGG